MSLTLGILDTEPVLSDRYGRLFAASEFLITLVFVLEYALRVWTCTENPRYASRWHFIRTPSALLDLLTLFVILASIAGTQGFLLRLARILRILRLARLGRFSTAWKGMFAAMATRRFELYLNLVFASVLLILAACALYLAEGAVQPEQFGSIPRAMWWSVATLTTVGYGDVVPITPLGRVLGTIVAVIGIGLIAVPTGILASAFSDALQKHGKPASSTEDGSEDRS